MEFKKPIQLPQCSVWIIRTDYDEADLSSGETIVSALTCKAEEIPGEEGPLTLITADHVRIVVPGSLWEIEEMPGYTQVR